MNPVDPIQLKEECLRWIFSIAGALLVYFIVAAITLHVYHPDMDHLYKVAGEVLAEPNHALPEPMEAMLFRLGIVTILSFLCLFYILLSRMKLAPAFTGKSMFFPLSVIFALLMLATIIPGFLAADTSDNTSRFIPVTSDGGNNTNFQFFFNSFFLGDYFWVYTLLFFPLICYLFFIGFKKKHWEDKKILTITIRVFSYAIIGGTLLCILLMNTFTFPYSVENRYDFAAVYYAMTQVFAGIPMLVNGFTDTYGLYPHFLTPIFKITGLSVFTFSLVMSLLQVLAFALNFYVLNKFTRNKVILFAGFTTLLFFSYLDRKLLNHFDNYFALFPIRYIIPSMLLFLSSIYLAAPSKTKYVSISVIMAAFVLWNPDIGITCYLSWIIMNIYHDFYNRQGKINTRAIITHLVTGICTALFVFYTYKVLIRAIYGAWPDLGLLGSTMSVFSSVGFGLMPMDTIHPWNVVALILIIGFTYAIAQWHNRQSTPRASMVMLLSLVGVGYLFYFQGRSHNSNLSASTGFCILLLTILGDELWVIVKKTNELFLNVLFAFFLFLISFSFIELFYNTPRILAFISQEEDKNYYADVQEDIIAGRQLIEQTSQEKEKILVLSQRKHQPLLLDAHKNISAFNPGLIDLFLQSDVHKLANTIADSSFSIYYEAEDIFFPFMSLPFAAMAATYEFKAYNRRTLVWLTKRTHHIPGKIFFTQGDMPLLHRKYNDDTAGTQQRINDAMGIAPTHTGNEFAVEALFYNDPQMFPEATIIGNAQDGAGFAIGRVFNSSRFFFSLNGISCTAPFQDNTWTYLVMNVYSDHMDIYRNGVRLLTEPLKSPVRNSEKKLFIGNMEGDKKARFFVGPIAEVNMANKAIDSTQIQTTWAEINQVVNAVK